MIFAPFHGIDVDFVPLKITFMSSIELTVRRTMFLNVNILLSSIYKTHETFIKYSESAF